MKLKQLHESREISILGLLGKQEVYYDGYFDCSAKNLTSLEGGPVIVQHSYSVGFNNLTSLQHGPINVGDYFYCAVNKITNLSDVKMTVRNLFSCANNLVTTLEGMNLTCGTFNCSSNKITSLKNIHKQLKLTGVGILVVTHNPLLLNNLVGVLLVEGIKMFVHDNTGIEAIINRHIGQTNKKLALLQCQQELIEAGYEEAAQL